MGPFTAARIRFSRTVSKPKMPMLSGTKATLPIEAEPETKDRPIYDLLLYAVVPSQVGLVALLISISTFTLNFSGAPGVTAERAFQNVVSSMEKAAVETSLAVLKADNGFDAVVFWGRITGISADYLIAQGYNLPYKMIDATSSPAVSFYR